MRQRITIATIRRCAFAICKAAAAIVSVVDRCAMQMNAHLFHARHSSASSANSSNGSSSKRLAGGLRGYRGCLQVAAAYEPATALVDTRAWRVRPMQVVRRLATVSLG